MSLKLTQTFLHGSHLKGNMAAVPKCVNNIDLLSSRLLQMHRWLRDRKHVRKCSSFCQNGIHTESIFSVQPFRQSCRGVCDRKQPDGKDFATTERTAAGGTESWRLWMSGRVCCRRFSTSVRAASKVGVGGSDHEQPEASHSLSQRGSRKDWALRLANENGYLSWCRNTYLTTVVALAMMEEGKTAIAEQAAEGALVVAALNLSWGTYQYIHNVVKLRHLTGTSPLGVGAYSSLALLHLGLWVMVCATFLGLTQDPDTMAPPAGKRETDAQTLEP